MTDGVSNNARQKRTEQERETERERKQRIDALVTGQGTARICILSILTSGAYRGPPTSFGQLARQWCDCDSDIGIDLWQLRQLAQLAQLATATVQLRMEEIHLALCLSNRSFNQCRKLKACNQLRLQRRLRLSNWVTLQKILDRIRMQIACSPLECIKMQSKLTKNTQKQDEERNSNENFAWFMAVSWLTELVAGWRRKGDG